MSRYLNPAPELPADAEVWNYRTGNWTLPGSWRNVTPSGLTFTNWQAAMQQAGDESRAPELTVFVTDGDPTSFSLNKPSDPHYGNGKNAGVNTDRGSAITETSDRSVTAANDVKKAGSRILAVGVGPEVTVPGSPSVDRLKAMSGPKVLTDLNSVENIDQVDVALVQDFKDLDTFLRKVAIDLCAPSLTVRKFAQTSADGPYEPAAGWNMTTQLSVPGGFNWVAPDTADAASKTAATDSNGLVQFQWDPKQGTAKSTAKLTEEVRTGYTAGRPGANNDWICQKRGPVSSNDVEITGDFADPQSPSIDLDVSFEELVTCSVYNSVAAPGPTPTPTKPRAPLRVEAVKITTYTPNVYQTIVKSSKTAPKVKLSYRTTCRPVAAKAAGEVTYCKTRIGKKGKVQVKVIGNQTVRVRQVIVATPVGKGADKYKRNTWTRTWKLSPKQ